MKRVISALFLCALLGIPKNSNAADMALLESQVRELMQTVHELKIVVEKQQAEISSLKRVSARSSSMTLSSGNAPVIDQASHFGTKTLPEVGIIADTIFKSDNSKEDENGADRVSVRTVELVLESDIDPYSHFDSTIAFAEEEVGLEEAYLTRSQLPLNIAARIGRFKPRIGKNITVHRDSLDTVDEPLVIQRYFGEEGMSKSGVDISKSLEVPSLVVHQITLGVLEGGNGEGGTAFGETKRRPTLYGHLKSFLGISDKTNLEIGLSDALGSRDADPGFEVNAFAVDGTLIHHLNSAQSLKLQTEIFNLNRRNSFIEIDDGAGAVTQEALARNLWGGYLLLNLHLNSQWATGFRYDQAEIVDRPLDSPEHYDAGYSGYLTFYQSEFVRWRLQFTHLDLTDGSTDNQIWVQGTFTIGEHKHLG